MSDDDGAVTFVGWFQVMVIEPVPPEPESSSRSRYAGPVAAK